MSEQAPAIVGIAALAPDCHDPAGLARWWSRLLGGEVEVDDDGDATLRAPGLIIDFQRVPEAKTVKNRLHLDLRSRDLAEATEQALALGATKADDIYDQGRWQVLRDPRATSSASSAPGPEPRRVRWHRPRFASGSSAASTSARARSRCRRWGRPGPSATPAGRRPP
jgi:Glyoxalase-like domain